MLSWLSKHFSYHCDLNLVELFKPVYALLSITGLFPYSIVFPKGRSDCKIVRQPLIAHFVCGILACAYVFTYFAITILDELRATEGALMEITFMIELFMDMICVIAAYFSAVQYRKVHVRMLKRIAFIWTDLSNGPYSNVSSILMFLRKLFLAPFVFWLLISLPVLIILWSIGNISLWVFLFLVCPEAIPSLVVLFYGAMVLMVVGLLKNITNHCMTLEMVKHQKSVHVIKANINLKEDIYIYLKRLELAYVNALEVKQEINKVFQAPIAMIIIQCFHTILSEIHGLYHELIIARHLEIYWAIDKSYTALYALAKMFLLTYTGSLLEGEVTQIGQVLHCLPYLKHDVNLLMQIQHFSTLISFYGGGISIYGFFALDSTLLFNMFASLATYLIILVQFDG